MLPVPTSSVVAGVVVKIPTRLFPVAICIADSTPEIGFTLISKFSAVTCDSILEPL